MASADPYNRAMFVFELEAGEVVISAIELPAYRSSASDRLRLRPRNRELTFLHVHPACGLWIAYLVITSRTRLYSSEADLKARLRSGML